MARKQEKIEAKNMEFQAPDESIEKAAEKKSSASKSTRPSVDDLKAKFLAKSKRKKVDG